MIRSIGKVKRVIPRVFVSFRITLVRRDETTFVIKFITSLGLSRLLRLSRLLADITGMWSIRVIMLFGLLRLSYINMII